MEHTNHIQKLFAGMAVFRQQLKQPLFDSKNPFFKSDYLSLEGVIKTIDPALKGTGLSWMQFVYGGDATPVVVQTMVSHESGQYFITPPLAIKPVKNDPQGLGSAITYEKRYQLASVFGIVGGKDDDGNEATRPSYHRQPMQQQVDQQTQNEINRYNFFLKKLSEAYKKPIQAVNEQIGKSVGGQSFKSQREQIRAYNDIAKTLLSEVEKHG